MKQSETAINLQDCRFSFLQHRKFGSSSTGSVSVGQEDALRKKLHKNVLPDWKTKVKKEKTKKTPIRIFGGTIFLP